MKLSRSHAGVLVAAVYVITAALTIHLTARHVRPLYEGFSPPPPYQWVNPPPEFRAGNQKPHPSDGHVSLTAKGSVLGAVNTDDGQLNLNLPDGAFPAHGADDSVAVHFTPLNPAALGALPSGLAADGNAYRVETSYAPSKEPTGRLTRAGNIFLVVPQPATALLFSSDGNAWQRLGAQGTGTTTSIAASFDGGGYFLAAMPPSTRAAKSSDTAKTVLVAALTVAVALGLLLGPAIWRRVRGRPLSTAPPRQRLRPPGRADHKRRGR